jgi:ABC-type sugar transport system substrate-binding protein/LysM repeat protein
MSRKMLVLSFLVLTLLAVLPATVSAAPARAAPNCDSTYVVQADDWLSKLADKFYGDVLAYPAIALATNANQATDATFAQIMDPDRIEVGQKLCIPSKDDATTLNGTTYSILVDMKGPGAGNPFWAAVEQGATEAAKKWRVVNLAVLAPPAETDIPAQIAQVEDQVTKKVNAIVIAPTDASGLNPTFDKAKAAGIPVLIIDSDTTWPDKLTFIGTDNRAGGKLAGEYICKQLGNTGQVAIITGVMTQQSHIDRVGGAREAMQTCGLNIVKELPANSLRDLGQTVMEDILTSNPDVAGVFASNDLMALGAIEAIRARGKLGQVVVVGFDANPDAAKSILAGEMSASVAQSPYNMGAFGVGNSLMALMGVPISKRIDTGTTLVDKSNAAAYQ